MNEEILRWNTGREYGDGSAMAACMAEDGVFFADRTRMIYGFIRDCPLHEAWIMTAYDNGYYRPGLPSGDWTKVNELRRLLSE